MDQDPKPHRYPLQVSGSPEILAELREGARLADLPIATWLRLLGLKEARRLKAEASAQGAR